MKKLHALALAAVYLLAGAVQSCANPPADKTKKNASKDENSVLWEVSGKGLSKPSYLFGTIHMICQADYFWSDPMQQAFDKTDKVCLEMDMDDMTVMAKMQTAFVDQSGKQLKDYFQPADYEKVRKYVKDTLGYNVDMFSKMKPFILVQLMIKKMYPCEQTVAYEEKLMGLAKPANKEIIGLESADEQIAVMNKIEADSIVSSVLRVVNGDNESQAELTKLIAAYKTQSLPELQKLFAETEQMSEEAMKALLEERNTRWIPRMEKMMNGQSVFFAVGAGHLPGDKGVIALLRKQGYTVTPIK
ncbi:MAG: TraB/GumN family protein [Flavipsychrobacter sp.]|nr:TraB/GumN family protein [Flavipsychrobacter sp.]